VDNAETLLEDADMVLEEVGVDESAEWLNRVTLA
jgi:hypothetical protein